MISLLIKRIPTNSNLYRISGISSTPVVLKRYLQKIPIDSTSFEVYNGVGGSEAMLFANEMLNVYVRYFESKHWPYEITEQDVTEIGGVKSAKLIIKSPDAFHELVQEAGVHRVQRVPKTEKHGRIHTSTITIAIIPQTALDIQLKERDLEVQTMRSSGPGGQHVNKTESAVRIIHKPTGIMVESQESRSQIDNRRTAMNKLLSKIQEIEIDRITSSEMKMKKLQVGNANRNEKIRTYNYSQDRITDHRVIRHYQGLKRMIAGDISVLEKIITDFRRV